jgi:hypothetical protein
MAEYYILNIGRPATTAWWQQNLVRGVITAGFNSQPGDRGEVILRRLSEGDGVVAYCSEHGFVGVGFVGSASAYKLHQVSPIGSLSNHRHERAVDWQYSVSDVSQAITLTEAGRHAPRQTAERESEEFVMRIVSLLEARIATIPRMAKHWRVLEAVRAIGQSCSVADISDWLTANYSGENVSDVRNNACVLTVNDANRRHHDRGRKTFRTDTGNPKDALFRESRLSNVTYKLYRPIEHGVWDLQSDGVGSVNAVRVPASAVQVALAEAHQQIASQPSDPIASDEDARIRELRAVAIREGQGAFRAGLLVAYGERCAMTGCAVLEILEAAHIKPYRGSETNRTDNGMLLRADIHTLFDKGLLWLDENLLIRTDDRLAGSEYAQLNGSALRVPGDPALRPHPDHLAYHRRSVRE